jgi:hypothetical protein
MRKLKTNEYRCYVCKNIYKKGWSDEEAIKEEELIFGLQHSEDDAIVCDGCFHKLALDD